MIAQATHDHELHHAFRDRYVVPRRDQGRVAIRRAVNRGELRTDLDGDVLLDEIYGALYIRLLFDHGPLNRQFTDQLVDHALRGALPEAAARWPATREPPCRRRAEG